MANMFARLPNFCNLGIMLRLLVIVNVLVIAAAILRAEAGRELSTQYLAISVLAQPAIIMSLLATCILQPLFIKLRYWQGVSTIFVTCKPLKNPMIRRFGRNAYQHDVGINYQFQSWMFL